MSFTNPQNFYVSKDIQFLFTYRQTDILRRYMHVRDFFCIKIYAFHYTANVDSFGLLTQALFIKWAKHGLFLFIFVLFTIQWLIYHKFDYKRNKSLDGLLGIQTWGGRMVGADGSTELWQHPSSCFVCEGFWKSES